MAKQKIALLVFSINLLFHFSTLATTEREHQNNEATFLCKGNKYLNSNKNGPEVYVKFNSNEKINLIIKNDENIILNYYNNLVCLKELENNYCRYQFTDQFTIALPKNISNFTENQFYSFAKEISSNKDLLGIDGWRNWPLHPEKLIRVWSISCQRVL